MQTLYNRLFRVIWKNTLSGRYNIIADAAEDGTQFIRVFNNETQEYEARNMSWLNQQIANRRKQRIYLLLGKPKPREPGMILTLGVNIEVLLKITIKAGTQIKPILFLL
jgi:hypothetical protein